MKRKKGIDLTECPLFLHSVIFNLVEINDEK